MAFTQQESSFQAKIKPEKKLWCHSVVRPSSSAIHRPLKTHGKIIGMRLAILGLREPVLVIQLILLDGMQVKAFIRDFQQLMLDHYILPIMRVTLGLKRRPTEKSNG